MVIRLQIGKQGPAPWRVLPETEIKGKDALGIPHRLVVQKVANHLRLSAKGLDLLPEVVCIWSLPERGIEDIVGMRQKGGIELLGHIEIRPDGGTTPTPRCIKPPGAQQGYDPLAACWEHRRGLGMAVTPPDTVHAQGEELVPCPILQPPDAVVILDHTDVGLGRWPRGLRVGQAQTQHQHTHKEQYAGILLTSSPASCRGA